ncbi:MAG TPA: ATP-grasp domain-containing protein [Vicinamibacterales bacterium]|nr:ATP-grasp domain-containing protein [Vicinamibacterales bacterium]
MTRVLLFSHTTGYQLRAFDDAAARLGIELVFATDRCHRLDDPWQDRAIPVRFYDIPLSLDRIFRRAREFPVGGILAVGDRPVVLAAHVAQALGIRWHSVAGAEASTDKCRSRVLLATAGLPAPRFAIRNLRAALRDLRPGLGDPRPDVSFPVVLKPVGLSGSRGVIRANDDEEYAEAFDRIRALLARPDVRAARTGLEDEILVEQYIDGDEFALEGVLTDGVLRVFALFDKPDPLVGPFFEETIYVTPSRTAPELQSRIAKAVEAAAHALGLGHGPVHAECRMTPQGEIYILEVAARPIGGLCSRVLTFASPPVSLEMVLLQHAIGQSIDRYTREPDAAAVMMIPIPRRGIFKRMNGVEAASRVAGVSEIRITAKEGQMLEPLPEAGSYLGFLFARGGRPEDAERAVRDAHALLDPEIAPALLADARG